MARTQQAFHIEHVHDSQSTGQALVEPNKPPRWEGVACEVFLGSPKCEATVRIGRKSTSRLAPNHQSVLCRVARCLACAQEQDSRGRKRANQAVGHDLLLFLEKRSHGASRELVSHSTTQYCSLPLSLAAAGDVSGALTSVRRHERVAGLRQRCQISLHRHTPTKSTIPPRNTCSPCQNTDLEAQCLPTTELASTRQRWAVGCVARFENVRLNGTKEACESAISQ